MTQTCSTPGHEGRPVVETRVVMGTEFRNCAECSQALQRSARRDRSNRRAAANRAGQAYARSIEQYSRRG